MPRCARDEGRLQWRAPILPIRQARLFKIEIPLDPPPRLVGDLAVAQQIVDEFALGDDQLAGQCGAGGGDVVMGGVERIGELIGVGLTRPPVVRGLGVAQAGRNEHVAEHEAEIMARRQALDAALKSLEAMTAEQQVSEEVMRLLRARHEIRVNQLPDSLDPNHHDVSAAGTALTRDLIAAERKFIHNLLRDGQITDETRRRIERDLDLEEASLANREYRGAPL